jgi:hypothetical protein
VDVGNGTVGQHPGGIELRGRGPLIAEYCCRQRGLVEARGQRRPGRGRPEDARVWVDHHQCLHQCVLLSHFGVGVGAQPLVVALGQPVQDHVELTVLELQPLHGGRWDDR